MKNPVSYGHYLIDELDELELPEAAKRFYDYKSYGREAVKEDRGTFTDYGYVYNNGNDYAQWYAAHDVPREYRITPQQMQTRDMDELPQGAAMPAEPIPVRPLELTATDTQGRVKEITEHLEQGVKDLFDSERYQDYLKAMDRDYYRNLIEQEKYFRSWLIAPKTWMVEVCAYEQDPACQCYLLEGSQWAVAIDSGCGRHDIMAYMKNLTELPILGVINTHSHFDHIAGNLFFPHVYIHEKVRLGASRAVNGMLQYVNPQGEMFWEIPEEGQIPNVTFVREGDTLDLGDRELEFLEIGAHDVASIAILDKGSRLLFTGDEVETGWCNVGSMRPAKWATIENHYNHMLKLKSREKHFDRICPGHHGAPIAKECLEHQIVCDRMIMEGNVGSDEIPFVVVMGLQRPETRILVYKTAHRGFACDCIFNAQVDEK